MIDLSRNHKFAWKEYEIFTLPLNRINKLDSFERPSYIWTVDMEGGIVNVIRNCEIHNPQIEKITNVMHDISIYTSFQPSILNYFIPVKCRSRVNDEIKS